jgi:hypothetical protein
MTDQKQTRILVGLIASQILLFSLVVSGMASVAHLQGTVVGKTPEGFHRVDAVELMEQLCLLNKDMQCPDPYTLPRFTRQFLED